MWSLKYDELQGFEKEDRIAYKKIPEKLHKDSGQDLRIKSKNGQDWLLRNVDKRDEAFSQVIGFSDVVWQVNW